MFSKCATIFAIFASSLTPSGAWTGLRYAGAAQFETAGFELFPGNHEVIGASSAILVSPACDANTATSFRLLTTCMGSLLCLGSVDVRGCRHQVHAHCICRHAWFCQCYLLNVSWHRHECWFSEVCAWRQRHHIHGCYILHWFWHACERRAVRCHHRML